MYREDDAYPNPFARSKCQGNVDFTADDFLHPSDLVNTSNNQQPCNNQPPPREGYHPRQQQSYHQHYKSKNSAVWSVGGGHFGGRPPPPVPTRNCSDPVYTYPAYANSGHYQRPRFEPRGVFRSRGRGHLNHQFLPRPRPYQPPERQPNQDQGADNPWITPELLKLIKEKDELWDVHSKEQTEESHRNFKIKRIEVNMAVNDAKILYFQQNPHQTSTHPQQNLFSLAPSKRSKYYCDPCDKDFISEEALEEHRAEHITCKLDGCTYTAHAKLVMKHIELQHSTNLFNRIKGYDTPEEIEKWKEERRKNFPTPENIVRKNLERAERKARGETCTAKDDFPGIEVFRHKIVPEKDKPRRIRRHGPEYQSDGDDEYYSHQSRMPYGKPSLLSFNKSEAIRLLNFYTDIEVNEKGFLSGRTRETWMKHDDVVLNSQYITLQPKKDEPETCTVEFNITDDECDYNVEESNIIISTINGPEVPPTASLLSTDVKEGSSSLISANSMSLNVWNGLAGYGTDSDEEDGEIKSDTEKEKLHEVPIVRACDHDQVLISGVDCELSSDGEAPEELPAIISKSQDNIILQEKISVNIPAESGGGLNSTVKCHPRNRTRRKRPQQQQNHASEVQAKRIKRKYSLLQRLLAPDIRKEKNMILQVCRFLVDRNFLDHQQHKPSELEMQEDDSHAQEMEADVNTTETLTQQEETVMISDLSEAKASDTNTNSKIETIQEVVPADEPL